MLVVNKKEGQESSLKSNVELPQILDTENGGELCLCVCVCVLAGAVHARVR